MPGDYRLVIKGHDGAQIGVLDAYESLTYEKLQNQVGEAILVANYGVTAATDTLLDELVEDVILEVQRHPDPTDASLDWYVDWMGFCDPPEEGITEVNTERKTWRFLHINRLLGQNLIQASLDGERTRQGQEYAVDRDLFSGQPRNIMRKLVRRQCVEPIDTSRLIPGLFVEGDEAEPTYVAGWPGWVYDEPLDFLLFAVHSSYTWLGELVFGTRDYSAPTRYQMVRTADGETWTNTYNGNPIWAFKEFDDTGGEQLYAAYSTPTLVATSGIYRSAVAGWGGWATVWNRNGTWTNAVLSLEEHAGQLYAGTGYGTYNAGGLDYAKGQIWRCLANDGTSWSAVYEGNPGGTGTAFDKYMAFEGLYSWNGYLYAGGIHYYEYPIPALGASAYLKRARILRSQTGDVGTWAVVHSVDGPTHTIDHPIGITTTQPTNTAGGFCCFCEFGAHLYAGIGDRWKTWNRDGRIYRTSDGVTWEQVFGAVGGEEHAEYSSPAITWLATHGGALWAGCGGPKKGDGQVWYTIDGTAWLQAFDQRGYESQTCHTIRSFNGAMYAGFGYIPYSAGGGSGGGYGYLWRMTGDDDWDPPNWAQEAGGNWPPVLEVLQGLAESTMDTEGGTDFEIVPTDFGGNLQEFQFRARSPWGTDHRTTSADPTTFGVNRGNMANPLYRKRKAGRATVVYALGVGTGGSRAALETRNPAAESDSPWARQEKTLSVQGVDTLAELYQQADAIRRGDGPLEEFTFDILWTPSTRYGVEWDVGCLASAVHNGTTYHVKITGATVRLGTNPVVEQVDAEILLLETA